MAFCSDGCHGGGNNEAPPPDLSGNVDTTFLGVGAHQSHLADGDIADAVECVECHVVPAGVGDAGHLDGALPAELTFSGVAVADGANPVWDRVAMTCSDTYCHGNTIADGGGSNLTPTWTLVGAGEAACGSCHGLPPGGLHPAIAACETCHPRVVDANQNIISPELHINGVADLF